jgi:hypothetical protein
VDLFEAQDADGVREEGVEGAHELVGADGAGVVGPGDGGDLAQCVDAGVGAAGAVDLELGAFGEAAEGALELALDGVGLALDLPAVEGGAVVGELKA